MSWNIRVMKYEDGSVGLHEVFYNKEGKIIAWTQESISYVGEDLKELKEYIDIINQDIERFGKEEDILDYNMKAEASLDEEGDDGEE